MGILLKRRPYITQKGDEIMAEEEMSPQLQDQINRFQQLKAQVQVIAQQRQQIEIQLRETEEALEELEKIDAGTPFYKSIGALLIKTKSKSEVKKDLISNKETLELRKTTLEKQEGRSQEKLNELQSKIQNTLKLTGKET